MPDLIRHPVPSWIPAFAGMTALGYLIAGVIYKIIKGKISYFQQIIICFPLEKI